jgi:indole-3-glycerol phosphate synthase
MNWEQLRAVKETEIRQLATVRLSEVTPSIRSFTQYVTTHRQDLAVIAALKRMDPQSQRSWTEHDLVALAQECDEAEIAAIAVYSEQSIFGSSMNDLQEISAAVSAPVLRLDLTLHPHQIYHARLCGADAVLLCAGVVDVPTLVNLVKVASAVHMAPVVAVRTPSELEQALTVGAAIVGISSPSGMFDLAPTKALAARVPLQKTVIVLDEISTPEEYAALQGKVDAVMVGNLILDAPGVGAALEELTR